MEKNFYVYTKIFIYSLFVRTFIKKRNFKFIFPGALLLVTGGTGTIIGALVMSVPKVMSVALIEPFDMLRNHPSTGSGTILRQAQEPPFEMTATLNVVVSINSTTVMQTYWTAPPFFKVLKFFLCYNAHMKKILFVCHGNICRSPMAEFVMKKLVKDTGRESEFLIESAATSTEEIGNDMHSGTKKKLTEMNIPFEKRRARRITAADYNNYDYLIGMDVENLYYMEREWDKDPDDKVKLLLAFAGKDRDIADPWYTGNFDKTYEDIIEGCREFLKKI